MTKLNNFFKPKSIAVVGASRDPKKVGRIILNNLRLEYPGKLFPVNQSATTIDGLKCYPNLLLVPEPIDLAIISIPAPFVSQSLKEAQKKGIKNVIILSAGFSEIGPEGAKLEQELKECLLETGILALGPNTLGFINNDLGLNATFASFWPKFGQVSFISQSGAFMTTFLDWATEREIGISKVICLGNKANVDEADALEFLAEDPQTKVIAIYLESFSNGSEFVKVAKNLINKKPLIIFKSGRSDLGKQRIASHTGKMAGSYESSLAAFRSIKAAVSYNVEEFFNLVYLFSQNKIISEKKLYILTNAGGPGVIATDEAIDSGWELPPLSPKGLEFFQTNFPDCASFKNPFDILGDAQPERFTLALKILNNEAAQNILILVSPQTMTDIPKTAQEISNFSRLSAKNIFTCFLGGSKMIEAEEHLKNSGAVNFPFSHQAFETLNKTYNFYSDWKTSPEKKSTILNSSQKMQLQTLLDRAIKEKKSYLDQTEVQQFAAAYELPLPSQTIVTNQDDVIRFAHNSGFPLVLKSQNLHKTDRREVYLNLNSEKSLLSAFNELGKITTGFLVQKQIQSDFAQFILGSVKDNDFGPVLSFGLGGIYTEVFRQFVTVLPPLTTEEISDLLTKQPFFKLLSPEFRGQKRPFAKICRLVQNFSELITDFPKISSAEVNPLIITEDQVFCVDFRILTDLS